MATGAPGTNGVWQYGEDDSEATFSALLNKVASSADTQIGTDRGRLTTLEARKLSGLIPMVPTTVTGVGGTINSISANGLVTFTTCTAVELSNVFTSAYNTYKVIISGSQNTTGTWQNYRFRTASGPATAASYSTQQLEATGTSVTAGRYHSETTGRIGYADAAQVAYSIDAHDVFSNSKVSRLAIQEIRNAGAGIVVGNLTSTYYANESHTGFEYRVPAGTISGTIQVLGYNS